MVGLFDDLRDSAVTSWTPLDEVMEYEAPEGEDLSVLIPKEEYEALPLPPSPTVIQEEAQNLRFASMQLFHLASDISREGIRARFAELDHKKASANDRETTI